MSFTMDNSWYVLYVKHNHERRISKELKRLNIKHFLPLIEETRFWGNRKVKVSKPLLPTYLFVQISSKRELYLPLQTNGVFYYLKCDKKYASLTNDYIDNMNKLIKNGFTYDLKVIDYEPKIGEKIEIKKGPLKGFIGKVIKSNNNSKVFLEIQCINRCITAVLHKSVFI